jgi:hypothetical protein
MVALNFNANNIKPAEPRDWKPLPNGDYVAAIIESGREANSKGNGSFIKLKFQITEGPQKDSVIYARLNIDNPSPTAVKIAEAELSAICHAVGILIPQDTTQLHNIPLVIKVKCKGTGDDMQNEIKGYSKKPAFAPQQSGGATPGGSTPPWGANRS